MILAYQLQFQKVLKYWLENLSKFANFEDEDEFDDLMWWKWEEKIVKAVLIFSLIYFLSTCIVNNKVYNKMKVPNESMHIR